MRSFRLLASAAVLSLALLLTAGVSPAAPVGRSPTSGDTAAATGRSAYSPTTRVVFSAPGERRVSRLVLRNIAGAEPGAIVRGVVWAYQGRRFTQAMVAASRRGVRVQVVVGGVSCRQPAFVSLRRGLGGTSRATCAYRSARGARTFAGGESQLHQKSWTFSRIGSARWVTVITSANAARAADAHQHNDAYQVVRNRALHNSLAQVFLQQRRDQVVRRPFRRIEVDETLAVTVGPWNSPRQQDPVVGRIRDLPSDAVVAIAVSNWSDGRGVRIARALGDRLRRGADVRVVASKPFSPRARRILLAAGASVRNAHQGPRRYHHHKFMAASYDSDGLRRTRVWAGSKN